ncbi:GD14163 [Drosophila simulans]|uniref:GD14163 n=1 Tax=Drosophila simulans TaxID=7240 RepID=B4NVQ6_DROSI|nr:GD14163 [Drosophila simulans]
MDYRPSRRTAPWIGLASQSGYIKDEIWHSKEVNHKALSTSDFNIIMINTRITNNKEPSCWTTHWRAACTDYERSHPVLQLS